ncbi:MAG: phosphoglycerate kinase [Chloroflexi bacterium]|nr:phosphoglycerate kinase [Chloroflexota bacterium]|tara:strand:+ start:980 stop:2119 length:1140 start_codon:yes stop_codon:yes gene_type:complete
MNLKDLHDLEKKYNNRNINVFLRCDLNITENDLSRIYLSIPTIKQLIGFKFINKIIICTHLGRPNLRDNEFSLINRVHPELEKILDKNIEFIKYDEKLEFESFKKSKNKIFLLENIRFFNGEKENDFQLSSALASLCDVYVNDAFGSSHRNHSSVYGISLIMDSYAGYLLKKEFSILDSLFSTTSGKLVLILGGAKIDDKVGILVNLIDKVEKVIVGGGMIANFLTNNLNDRLNEIYKKNIEKFYIPEDLLVSENFSKNSTTKTIFSENFDDSLKILDIGKKSLSSIEIILKEMETVLWNGSMGVFEWEHCSIGTKGLINILSSNKKLKSYAGGGSTIEAINNFGKFSSFEHVSSGGGAFLEMLEKGILPSIKNLLKDE